MARKIEARRRRRTVDELNKALAVFEDKKDLLRIHADDEHFDVLIDAVQELLALRQIVTIFTQQIDLARQEAATALKNILTS